MLRRSNALLSIALVLTASAVAFAQNLNSSNAASTNGSNVVMLAGVGAVILVAGVFTGYFVGRKSKG